MNKKRLVIALFLVLGMVAVLLFGCGTAAKITVTFDSMGGNRVSPMKVYVNADSITLPTPRSREGYTFDYWCYDYECTQRVDETVVPQEDVTFYAKWTQQRIAVTFNAEGERRYVFVPYGGDLPLSAMPAVPEKEGYAGRWNTGDLKNLKSNIVIEAIYTVASYSIVYAIGNDVYFSVTGEPGTQAEVPSDPDYPQTLFLGWYLDADFSAPLKEPATTFSTTDRVLYGRVISVADMERCFLYSYSDVDSTARVVGLSPEGKRASVLVLPTEVNGYTVVGVADGDEISPTFSSEALVTLILPESVEYIGEYAFAELENLSEIRLSEGTKAVGKRAFFDLDSLESLLLPATVERIADGAFAGCENLSSVTFAAGSMLEELGNGIFSDCPRLTSFALPDSDSEYFDRDALSGSAVAELTSASPRYVADKNVLYDTDKTFALACAPAFSGEIVIVDGCTDIADGTFENLTGLYALTLPSSIKRVGKNAFSGCSNLSDVRFAAGIESIGSGAFARTAISSLTLPGSVRAIGAESFRACAELTEVDLTALGGETPLDRVGEYAFADCTSLRSLSFGAVRVIGDHAFYNCVSLRSPRFAGALNTVEPYAFADCLSLSIVNTLPSSLSVVGEYAFAGVSAHSTADVTLPTGVTALGDYAFMNTEFKYFTPSTALVRLGVGVFKNCADLKRARLPQNGSVSALPDEFFYGCTGISTVDIPLTYTTLGDYAFFGCTGLTSVQFNSSLSYSGVTSIGESCFENCSSLKNGGGQLRLLPSSVDSIGARAFKNCASLQQVTLPAGLKKVSAEAFAYCTSLTSILYDEDCLTDTLDEGCFAYCTALTKVRLPERLSLRGTEDGSAVGAVKNPFVGCSALNAYEVFDTQDLLSVDGNGVVYAQNGSFRTVYLYPTGRPGSFSVENDVVEIDEYAFFGARLSTLTFNSYPTVEGVETVVPVKIGDYAFAESALSSATVSKRVYDIGVGAFARSSLTSAIFDGNFVSASDPAYTVPTDVENNLLTVRDLAFSNTSLTYLALPARTGSIGDGAFSDCHALRTLTFESGSLSDLTVGKDAFRRDGYLTDLTFPTQLTEIGDYAFADCFNVSSVVFSSLSPFTVGEYAFKSNHLLYSLTLPATLTTIGEGAFADCTRLTDVVIAEDGTEVELSDYLFYGDGALLRLHVPARVSRIGKFSFVSTSLEAVTFAPPEENEETLVVDEYAFYSLSSLKTVDLPADLTYVGAYAFAESGLTAFSYGETEVTFDDFSFFHTPLTSVVVKPGVTLGDHAFAETEALEELTVLSPRAVISDYAFFGSGVRTVSPFVAERIGAYAFAGCKNLTSSGVSFLPQDLDGSFVSTVGEYAYAESGLTSFDASGETVLIRAGAFSSCERLAEFSLSANSLSVEGFAFADSALTRLSLSGTIASLSEGFAPALKKLEAFDLTDSDGKYYVEEGVAYLRSADKSLLLQYPAGKAGSTLYLSEDVVELADYAFAGNHSLSTLIVESDVAVRAYENTFDRDDLVAYVACDDLAGYADWSIRVEPYSQNVDGLILRSLGQDRYAVVDYVGYDEDVVIPGVVTSNDERRVSLRIERVAENAFLNNLALRSVVVGNGVREIGAYAFAGCENLTSVTLGNNVVSLGDHAFADCGRLRSVDFNDDLLSIGKYAFANCVDLEEVALSASLRTVDSYAFAGCEKLSDVTFGDNLTELNDNVFENDLSLVSLHLPASLSTVGNYAFRGCENLLFIYFDAINVPALKSAATFGATAAGMKLLVPAAAEKAYLSDSVWRNFSVNVIGTVRYNEWLLDSTPFIYENYVLKMLSFDDLPTFRLLAYLGTEEDYVMPEEEFPGAYVTEIGSYAFGPFTKTVSLASGVVKIDDSAFENAKNLLSVGIPDSVKSIGKNAFAGLKDLTSVTFNENVDPDLSSIGDYAFFNCSSLTSFALPKKLTYIGESAFSGEVMHLKHVTSSAPASLALRIGEYAFANNVDLTELTFNCMISAFGYRAFADCVSFESLYLNALGGNAPVFFSSDPNVIVTVNNNQAPKDDLVFHGCDHLVVFLPANDVSQKYKQAWGLYTNSLDRNRIFLSRNVTASYYVDGELFEQDGFVVSQNQSGESTATIVSYVGDETEVVFPSTVRLNGVNVDLTVTRIGRDENNVSAVNNGRVVSDAVTKVTIPGTVVSVSGDAFRGAKGLQEVIVQNGDNPNVSVGNYAFADCSALEKVTLSYNVSSIGQYAFSGCSSLVDFAVTEYPSSAVDKNALAVGRYAFNGCTSLSFVSFPKHLGTLGDYAFNGTTSLFTVDFGENSSATAIGQYCFAYSGLHNITLPGTVSNVGDSAFAYCNDLSYVRLTRTTAQYSSLTTTSENVFRSVNSVFIKVYVPESNLAQYENAVGWSRKSVIPDLSVGEYNYRRATAGLVTLTAYLGNDKHVVVPSTLTVDGTILRVNTISSYFGNETVEEFSFLPDCQISNLNDYAFAGCTALRRIHLPNSVTGIGEYCFADCVSLTDVTLSEQMNSFANYAFYNCTSLREISIPESAGGIGMAAFLNCSALERVEVGFSQVPTLGLSAFVNTDTNLVIIVPDNTSDAFANEWTDYASKIFDHRYLFGDFVVKDDSHGGYILVQYLGDAPLDWENMTVNGRKITSVAK